MYLYETVILVHTSIYSVVPIQLSSSRVSGFQMSALPRQRPGAGAPAGASTAPPATEAVAGPDLCGGGLSRCQPQCRSCSPPPDSSCHLIIEQSSEWTRMGGGTF